MNAQTKKKDLQNYLTPWGYINPLVPKGSPFDE